MTRLSADEAVNLIENAELNELGAMALARKRELHPQGVTTFIVDRNINYTNACWVDCKFCAFYRDHKDEDAYVLGFDEIGRKIEELIAIGGTQILFQGGVHPKLKIEWYEDLVEFIAKNYPSVAIHGFSAVEIDYIARISRISTREALRRLREKGLYSMPGAGAEILSDRVRDLIAPKKCDVQTWLRIHREAHEEGLKTTATMMFGTVETTREIVEHWETLAGRYERLSSVYLVEFSGAKHAPGRRAPRDQKAKLEPLFAPACRLQAVFRQCAQHPKQLGHAGQLHRAAGAAVWRKRLG